MYMKQTGEQAAGTAVLPHPVKIDFAGFKQVGKYGAALLLLIALSVGAYKFWQQASSHEDTEDAYVTAHVSMVSPRVSGFVKSVLVDDNQYVKAGDTLVVLDPADYQVAVDNARASLNKAEQSATAAGTSIDYSNSKAGAMKNDARGSIDASTAAIKRAGASLDNARTGVPMAQAALSQRQAELDLAVLNYNRMKGLREQGAISQQTLDTSLRDRDVAELARASAADAVRQSQSQVQVAEQGVSDAEAQLIRSRASLDQAHAESVQTVVDRHQFDVSKAAIDEAKAQLENSLLQLSYTRVVAPVSGRVGKKTVEIGQQVQAGQPLLAVVPDQFWIVANFKETQLTHMKTGQQAEVKIDAIPNHPLKGTVDSFAPGSGSEFALLPSDNATGNFTKIVQRVPVKILLDSGTLTADLRSRIVPGMSVEAEVAIGHY